MYGIVLIFCLQYSIMSEPNTSQQGLKNDFFINDNLLIKSSVEKLTENITQNWIALKRNDNNANNSSRKSITALIQKLCRKEASPNHACWTSNPFVAPYFIKRIISTDKSSTNNTLMTNGQKLNRFLKEDLILGKLMIDNVSVSNLYSLSEENYLPFIYATLNLEVESSDLHKIVNKHLELYKANKNNLDYRHFLEEVFRRNSELNISIYLLEQILLVIPNIIENQLLDFITNLCESKSIINLNLDLDPLNNVIMISRHSPHCFQMCSKILNTIFIETNYSQLIYILIQKYIKKVKEQIFSSQYVLLYPEKFHKIVQYMEMSRSPENERKLCGLYEILIQNGDEKFALMLLTHNSKWFSILYNKFVPNIL